MSSSTTTRSAWSRPSFIAAAIVVVLLLTLGIVLAVRGLGGQATAASSPSGAPSVPAQPSSAPTAEAGGSSVCGLKGAEDSGTLAQAPVAEWKFQGTTAYPTSTSAGPGQTSASGVRSCFQHTPEGALVATANAIVQALDPTVVSEWADQFVAQGEYRAQILAGSSTPAVSSPSTRLNIAGFRLLAYDGTSARVDIAVRASANGTPVIASAVYELVWQGGDWKLSADTAASFNFAAIPDLAGYIAWGA